MQVLYVTGTSLRSRSYIYYLGSPQYLYDTDTYNGSYSSDYLKRHKGGTTMMETMQWELSTYSFLLLRSMGNNFSQLSMTSSHADHELRIMIICNLSPSDRGMGR